MSHKNGSIVDTFVDASERLESRRDGGKNEENDEEKQREQELSVTLHLLSTLTHSRGNDFPLCLFAIYMIWSALPLPLTD